MEKDKKYLAIKERIEALYHNCKSSACFLRSDANTIDDIEEAKILKREAVGYEVAAGWLHELTKII